MNLHVEMYERPRRAFTETRSRNTDGQTSRDAAVFAASRKADQERKLIMCAVMDAHNGLTAREVAAITKIDYIEVQRRISECGLTKTDQRRDGCFVWSASA